MLRRGIFGAVVEVSTTLEVFVTSVGFVVGATEEVVSVVDCAEHPRSMRGNKANSGRFISVKVSVIELALARLNQTSVVSVQVDKCSVEWRRQFAALLNG